MQSLIYLGADHAGFSVKESLKRFLEHIQCEYEDLGAHDNNPTDDYPVYAARVASAVRDNPRSLGILICGSAEGICIAANKFDGIRAGIGFSIGAAKSLRADDHGNILCLPARLGVQDDIFEITRAFLETAPSPDARHERRLQEISHIESVE